MSDSEKVTAYVSKQSKWSAQLDDLRDVFHKTELREEVKWGCPSYTLNGKLVAGMAAFKNHYAIWFHQGVFLKDSHKKLVNAQEGKTKALRQWKFVEGDKIDKDLVHRYIQESIENCIAGREIKPERKTGVNIPPLLKDSLSKNEDFKVSFAKLTPGKQREYAEYIESAKREATQISRLEKIIRMIHEGAGLHEKYKNC